MFRSFFLIVLLHLPLNAGSRAVLFGAPTHIEKAATLPGIEIDLRLMRTVAQQWGYEQINEISGPLATRSRILAEIEKVIKESGPNDRVLIYFSGHGATVKDDNGDEDDDLDEVLIPYDVVLVGDDIRNFIRDDEIEKLINKSVAGNIFFVIDACNSATVTKGLGDLSDPTWKVKRFPLAKQNSRSTQLKETTLKGFGVESSRAGWLCLSAANDNEEAIATPHGSLFTLGIYETVTSATEQKTSLSAQQLQKACEAYIKANARKKQEVHHPVLTGNPKIFDRNLFALEDGKDYLQWLEKVAGKSSYLLQASANKHFFSLNEALVIDVAIPADGYLNILCVDSNNEVTVLFPNRYASENRVYRGGTLQVPSADANFILPAQEPKGNAMVVLFHTENNVNFFKDFGSAESAFKQLSSVELTKAIGVVRGFAVEGPENGLEYGAKTLHFKIR